MKTKKLSSLGFTLIELLIVIALLGALAVGLIGALDPVQQIRKGSDTGMRDLTNQIRAASERFYAAKGYMPWCTSSSACGSPEPSGSDLNAGGATSAIAALMNSGEVKASWNATNNTKIFISGVNSTGAVTVCFNPASKAFLSDPNAAYDKTGAAKSGCPSGADTTCHWCIKNQ